MQRKTTVPIRMRWLICAFVVRLLNTVFLECASCNDVLIRIRQRQHFVQGHVVTLVLEVCLLNGFNGSNQDTGLPFYKTVLFRYASFWCCITNFLFVRDEKFSHDIMYLIHKVTVQVQFFHRRLASQIYR